MRAKEIAVFGLPSLAIVHYVTKASWKRSAVAVGLSAVAIMVAFGYALSKEGT